MAVLTPHREFDASLYPRTYTASLVNRVTWVSLGALLGVVGLLGVWYFGTGRDAQNPKGGAPSALISFSFVALGGYLALSMLMFKVILKGDSIEVQGVGSKQILLRADIAGRRLLQTRNTSTLELVPRESGRKKLKIGMYIRTDAAFDAWFGSIPDLDAAELAESERQIAGDLEFGLTPEQRSERLAKARTTAKYLSGIAWTAAVWAAFYPRPYGLVVAILAALPLIVVALLLGSKGLYQLDTRRNDARPSLGTPFMLPGAFLTLRTVTADIDFLRWTPLLLLCLTGGIAFTLLLASADRQTHARRSGVLAVFVFAVVYALGASAQADVLLDRSLPQTFEVVVLRKWASSGRTTTYHLRVPPWGPRPDVEDISVPQSLYNAVLPKQTVCLKLFPGALRIPWYFATSCR